MTLSFPLTKAIKMTKIKSVTMNRFPKIISVVEKQHAFIKFLTCYSKSVSEVNTFLLWISECG